jgi:hypothetical protein
LVQKVNERQTEKEVIVDVLDYTVEEEKETGFF